MGRLVYSMIVSLDGYVEDRGRAFDFPAPDEEAHHAANDQAGRPEGAEARLGPVATWTWQVVPWVCPSSVMPSARRCQPRLSPGAPAFVTLPRSAPRGRTSRSGRLRLSRTWP